jgi:hypothetical protein
VAAGVPEPALHIRDRSALGGPAQPLERAVQLWHRVRGGAGTVGGCGCGCGWVAVAVAGWLWLWMMGYLESFEWCGLEHYWPSCGCFNFGTVCAGVLALWVAVAVAVAVAVWQWLWLGGSGCG